LEVGGIDRWMLVWLFIPAMGAFFLFAPSPKTLTGGPDKVEQLRLQVVQQGLEVTKLKMTQKESYQQLVASYMEIGYPLEEAKVMARDEWKDNLRSELDTFKALSAELNTARKKAQPTKQPG
jgi:hypothetical protein